MDGKRLKKLRNEKKLTQTELGKIINVSKVSISGYENGERTPDTDNLRRLADYFQVTSDYLLGRSDNPNPSNSDFNSMNKINELIKKYGIEHSGFFDIEKWETMGPEEIIKLEEYFEFITSKAKEKNTPKD